MEERKTAAIVLSILALIAISVFGIIPYINLKRTHTLSFKGCAIDFKYHYHVDEADFDYIIAQNQLGLCLCNAYIKKPDSAIAKKIVELSKLYGGTTCPNNVNCKAYGLDTILKHKDEVFDPKLGWDD